ncbi:helix-turn-helix domain-containing protein [Halogeometricum limi]|uniref:Predicted DNA binding protein, contains HTH domain n=1 Tax=Halogeometricum limi TaxID=555875 RepID=A0A1I6FWH1_9EURY|nr:helix-turn-helix domain-containing protein [Halogeometricum limi]SFR34293.1 Predicted DNA binding protein, contains HTH domain [Halogeometricum limi]
MLRYATLSLSGEARAPMFDVFDGSSAVSLESTRYLGPIEDGQHVGLSDVRGSLTAARELLAANDDVLQYDVAGTDARGMVYAHYRSADPITDLLEILYRRDIVLDWPVDHRQTERGPVVQFSIVGTDEGIRRATAEIPDVVAVSVEQVGRLEPRVESDSVLTDGQAALLDLALEHGYYEVPRETTQRALAERVGVAPGTVADRLQRIERRVMTAYAERSADYAPE